jgi:phage terminase small subunit
MPRPSAISQAYPPPPGKRLQPPDDLVGPEREVFRSVVASVEPSHFHNSDLPVLCVFVRAVVQERVASGEIAATGYLIDGKLNPMVTILRDAQRVVGVYSRLLRLNPVARTPLPSKSEPQSASYYDGMSLLEEAKRDDAN